MTLPFLFFLPFVGLDLVFKEESLKAVFEILVPTKSPQTLFDPLRKLVLDIEPFITFIDQENACVVILVPNAPSNDLVDLSNRRHLVPVVSREGLVLS